MNNVKITIHPERKETGNLCPHSDMVIDQERELAICARCGEPLKRLEPRVLASYK